MRIYKVTLNVESDGEMDTEYFVSRVKAGKYLQELVDQYAAEEWVFEKCQLHGIGTDRVYEDESGTSLLTLTEYELDTEHE